MAARKPTPDTRTAPADVMKQLFGVLMLWRQRVSRVVASLEITLPQADLLRRLEPDTRMPMGQIAEALTCDASNVTGLVDRLEARGLIERLTLPHDRRIKAIALTKAGRIAREKFLKTLLDPPKALTRLDERDLKKLLDAFGILTNILSEPKPESPSIAPKAVAVRETHL